MSKYDLSIDKHALDREWEEQPTRFHAAAVELADAREELEYAKAKLDIVHAEVYASLLRAPEEYGLTKTTEASLKQAIVCQPEYKAAHDDMVQAKHAADVLDAAVKALEQRKRALEKLVDLHLSDYYSAPRSTARREVVADKSSAMRKQRIANQTKERRERRARRKSREEST